MIITKEKIILECEEIIKLEGICNINIRKVAKKCGVSIGTIYNYFPSKSDLIIELIRKIWSDSLNMSFKDVDNYTFVEYIEKMLVSIKAIDDKYPNFLKEHSIILSNESRIVGKNVMSNYFSHLKLSMKKILLNDKLVKKTLFDDDFTIEVFLDYIFSIFMIVISDSTYDYKLFLKFIEKYLY